MQQQQEVKKHNCVMSLIELRTRIMATADYCNGVKVDDVIPLMINFNPMTMTTDTVAEALPVLFRESLQYKNDIDDTVDAVTAVICGTECISYDDFSKGVSAMCRNMFIMNLMKLLIGTQADKDLHGYSTAVKKEVAQKIRELCGKSIEVINGFIHKFNAVPVAAATADSKSE